MQIAARAIDLKAENAPLKGFLCGEGLPGSRTEHWRMTPISQLYHRRYQAIQAPSAPTSIIREAIEEYIARWQIASQRLVVLCDGILIKELSDFPELGLASHVLPETDYARLPFAGQNHAVATPVCQLDINGSLGQHPLHVLCLSLGGAGQASFGKLHINARRGSTATVIESHLSLAASEDCNHYVNQWVHVDVQQGARLCHYKWQQLDDNVLHIAASQTRVAADATYDGFVLHLGGQRVRHDHEVMIDGSLAKAVINGAYIGAGAQHIDNTSQIQHAARHSYSREVFKGVLADKAKGVFQARIHVHQVAQLTDAYQMNRALLLSPLAEVNAKPELEIYADDVKCSHGATVGELDADQLFYLTSRGIARHRATAMLIEAYLEDVFADMHDQASAAILSDLARKKLHAIAARLTGG